MNKALYVKSYENLSATFSVGIIPLIYYTDKPTSQGKH